VVLLVFYLIILHYLASLTRFASSSSTSSTDVVHQNSNDHGIESIDTQNNETITIGVASTITSCGSEPFVDGAAVLKYSLETHSLAHGGGKYNYQLYIMYHPNARECVSPLKNLGFTLLERPTPVNVDRIRGDFLREKIVTNGCCGEVSMFVCGWTN
jgi:hypothetical protein